MTGFGGLQAMICAMMYFAMARQRSLANCAVVSLMRLRSACTLVSIAMAASLATCREVMIRLVCPACSVFLPTALSSSGREVIASLRVEPWGVQRLQTGSRGWPGVAYGHRAASCRSARYGAP